MTKELFKTKAIPKKLTGKRSPLPKRLVSLSLAVATAAGALVIGYRQVKSNFVRPQIALVLGGEPEREKFAIAFAQAHPEVEIWVSSGSPPEYTRAIFAEAGIKSDRLKIDRRAIDTVTNFTTLVTDLQAEGADSIYLITSDDHMGRAMIIGEIVLGSRGIIIKPVSLRSGRSPEPWLKSIRDGARAILWVFTGKTGSSLIQF